MMSRPLAAIPPCCHFTVPLLPPSVNHYKQPSARGGWYRTKAAIAFIDAVCVFSGKLKVPGTYYAVEIYFYLGPKKRNLSSNDLDNFQKVSIDALARAGVIENDGRILDLYLHKRFCLSAVEERTEYIIQGSSRDEREVFYQGKLSAETR
jgi:Holliday junction resolvase RusA-like endonuclease